MPYRIAVASGKGGTGKTTVAVSLFNSLKSRFGEEVILVDCDVEEPNDLLFFSHLEKRSEEEICQRIPVIDNRKCTFCRKCVSYCEFNAIVVIPPVAFAEVNAALCHSCGACVVACEAGAVSEKDEPIGAVNFYGDDLVEGRLRIGSAMQTMLIKELKQLVPRQKEVVIYDAPPGTSCPVVETVREVDYVVLVSEPTPFGLHDLKLMVSLMREMNQRFGVIINKAGLGNEEIYHFIKSEAIELLGEIPFNRVLASDYASGELVNQMPEALRQVFGDLADKLLAIAEQ